jgi:hypothetical protein
MRTGTASARLRLLAFGAPAVFLAAFHGALLLRHFADASITRPLVLGRWAFTLALLAAAFIARRFVSGRHAVITFWLLVAVLHLAAPAGDRVFDAREDVALLVAVLPALIGVSAILGGARSVLWPASMLIAGRSIVFLPLRVDPFQTGRAPPRF